MPIQGDSPLPPNIYVSLHPDFCFQPSFLVDPFTQVIKELDLEDVEIFLTFRPWFPGTSLQLGITYPNQIHKFLNIDLLFSPTIRRTKTCKKGCNGRYGSMLSLTHLATAIIYHELVHISERKKRGNPYKKFSDPQTEENIASEKEIEYMQSVIDKKRPYLLELLPKK